MLELGNRRQGIFLKLPATEVVDVVASSGFDFAVVDREHSQLSEADALRLVRHAHAVGLPALVRLPELDRGQVNRLLEAGAAGVQLSTVRRASQVAELRAATRYAPNGDRSISLAHAGAGYGASSLPDYLRSSADAPPAVVAQIETATTDDPLDQILAARPDVAFIGITDLTVDMGLDAERVRERVDQIAEAAEAADVTVGAFGIDDPRVRYDVVTSDLALLSSAVRDAA
jgi:2-keto-3-deoxy-L-rhamnonate aldolase RhmA